MNKKDYYKENKDILSNKIKEYYTKNRDALLNKSKEYYKNDREVIRERARNKYKSLTEGKKQKMKEYQKEYQKKYRKANLPLTRRVYVVGSIYMSSPLRGTSISPSLVLNQHLDSNKQQAPYVSSLPSCPLG